MSIQNMKIYYTDKKSKYIEKNIYNNKYFSLHLKQKDVLKTKYDLVDCTGFTNGLTFFFLIFVFFF